VRTAETMTMSWRDWLMEGSDQGLQR